ncbi:MAG: RIP metalloprotease RseP [Bacteroidales bacterium]|nr:RIP metalloprotease RseP [Bacteroidales bacterium]
MGVVIQISQLLLSLSLLIILHEMGHFIFARLFRTRVEKFYLFFNPWFSLFKIKRGETEYGLGWLPLGGYVKIAGMMDESMDKEQLKQPPQPYEFRSKPTWQRLLIMLGGVIVNLVLGFVIYAMVLFVWGEKYLPNSNLKDGIWCVDPIANDIGFRNGDKIISINGKNIERFEDIFKEILFGGSVKVIRADEEKEFQLPGDFINKIIDKRNIILFYPRVPFIIKEIPDTSLNARSGLMPKDRVIGINSVSFRYYDEYQSIIDTIKSGIVQLKLLRNGEVQEITATLNEQKKLQIYNIIPTFEELEKLNLYQLETNTFTFAQSIPAGWMLAKEKLGFYIKQFKLIFDFKTGAYKGLGGFGTIGGLFPKTWEWDVFWEITAFLSLILAFMNVLPIPALDGGHVTFLLYEIVTGRKPNEKFLEYAQIAGMILVLGLVLVANLNDILYWLGNK